MPHFTDTKNRRWKVQVEGRAEAAVRSALGLDLAGLVRGGMQAVSAMLMDAPTLRAILWIICCDQAAKFGVTQGEFHGLLEATDGQASAAFLQAVLDAYLPSEDMEVRRTSRFNRALRNVAGRSEAVDTTAKPEVRTPSGRKRRATRDPADR